MQILHPDTRKAEALLRESLLAWQEDRNCFLSKWERLFSWEVAKAVWKRSRPFHVGKGVFGMADRKACFPFSPEINQTHEASHHSPWNGHRSGKSPWGHSAWSEDLVIPAWQFTNQYPGHPGSYFFSYTIRETHPLLYISSFLSWVGVSGGGKVSDKGGSGTHFLNTYYGPGQVHPMHYFI